MFKYVIKRSLMAILTIFLVSTITFFIMYLVPGGPFLSEKAPSQATLDALNAKYGLDKPLIIQYKNYIVNVIQGDLGPSLKQRGRTVNDIIATGFPVSARLGGISILIAFSIGVPMGCIAALKRGKALDNCIILMSSAGVAVPSFVISTVLMYLLSVKLGLLPTYGLSSFKNYIMPLIALSFYPISYITRLMRSSMLDVMGQDYMRTARAKGLRQSIVLFKHALRNAITPVVTYLGPLLAYTLTGSFVVEKIFTIPGIGREFISSTINRDYPLIMGLTIFLAALIIIMNMVVDIINKYIDPRIQLK
ncbi:MAG: ABC transporter permease [Eubacteriales bacterium]